MKIRVCPLELVMFHPNNAKLEVSGFKLLVSHGYYAASDYLPRTEAILVTQTDTQGSLSK